MCTVVQKEKSTSTDDHAFLLPGETCWIKSCGFAKTSRAAHENYRRRPLVALMQTNGVWLLTGVGFETYYRVLMWMFDSLQQKQSLIFRYLGEV